MTDSWCWNVSVTDAPCDVLANFIVIIILPKYLKYQDF